MSCVSLILWMRVHEDGAAPEDEEAAAADCAEPEADAPPAPAGDRAARPDECVERGGMPSLSP